MKKQPRGHYWEMLPEYKLVVNLINTTIGLVASFSHYLSGKGHYDKDVSVKCPYGQIGDVLWVRETWGVGTRPHPFHGWIDGFEYKADEIYLDEYDDLPLYPVDGYDFSKHNSGKWKPSIFMPREACRIKLEVTNIRVERLGDITEEDAMREGIRKKYFVDNGISSPESMEEFANQKYHTKGFKHLWQSINGNWNPDQWVWVIEFKKL